MSAGVKAMKQALAFLAAEVYENDSSEDRAAHILGQLEGAPLNIVPTVAAIADALKDGQP